MTEAALRVAILLMGAYALVIVGLFAAALFRGWRWKRKTRLTARLLPEIRAALVDYLAGSDDLTQLRRFLKISRRDVLKAILSFQDSVAGTARDRLCALALDLDLLEKWRRAFQSRDLARRRAATAGVAFVCAYEPCRREVGEVLLADALEDPDPEVRVRVAQALAQFGSPAEIEKVFRMAIRSNLVTRVSVAGPLRAHALELSRGVVTEALQSDNAPQILGALEMVVAWERAVPLVRLDQMMQHRERAIRLLALRAVPLVASSRENDSAVMQLLVDQDHEIAMAAAAVAGRLHIVAAVPLLARCFRAGNAALARTAAAALAAMPPQGWKALEELAASENPMVRSAAAEALAHVRAAKGT